MLYSPSSNLTLLFALPTCIPNLVSIKFILYYSIILVNPNGAGFFIYEFVFLDRTATLPFFILIFFSVSTYRLFGLVSYFSLRFILTQNPPQGWNRKLKHCLFWSSNQFCLNCCISTKLSLIVYLINIDMSKCQMWLQVMEHSLILLVLGYFSIFLLLPEKKGPRPRPKWIYKHVSDNFKKYLSVGNFGILSVVVGVSSASTAFTGLCTGL